MAGAGEMDGVGEAAGPGKAAAGAGVTGILGISFGSLSRQFTRFGGSSRSSSPTATDTSEVCE